MKCILTGATRKSMKNFWVKWLNDIFSESVNNQHTMKRDIIMQEQTTHTHAYLCIQGFFSNYIFRSESDLMSLLSCSACSLQKSPSSTISNHIGMKFDRNSLHINMHRLTESHLWFADTISKWWPWCSFTQQSAVLPLSEWKWNICLRTCSKSSSSWSVVH